ncbi:MAG: chemotaxis protein CheA [Methylococcales bacterium]|nr:chemotaxis protein CheA [Methylococcales bacterium]
MTDLDPALATFAQESEELLLEMESALLVLESDPSDSETINQLFRAVHTFKGSAGLFGFDQIVAFAHQAETLMDQVRNGERVIDDVLTSVLLEGKDHLSELVQHFLATPDAPLPEALHAQSENLIARLNPEQKPANQLPTEPETALQTEDNANFAIDECWLISLDFQQDALRNGMDPLSFIRYLLSLGEIQQILTLYPNMPDGQDMDPESCYLHFKIAFRSDADKKTLEQVFEFAADDCEIKILPPNARVKDYLALLDNYDDHYLARLGEMLIQIGSLTEADVDRALKQQSQYEQEAASQEAKPLGEILVEQRVVQKPLVEEALKKQEQTKQKLTNESNYIRVDADKLGRLINLVGELVISSAAMNLIVQRHGISDAEDVAAAMNSLVNSMRDTALELRMVQIGDTFSRFRRVVRDVSKDLGKDIELQINGGETELDKTVVEKINDPLTHLVRNSLDHGVEPPEQRVAAGKPAQGRVTLNAYHESGHIVIEISDDGAGLNSEKILTKAIANGLVKPDQTLSQQEIFQLIFAPGLSTKDKASNLSGRGVGMDVVKRNIEALRGSVAVYSTPGQGTTIGIQLPLTLAIIDGFMIGAGHEHFIIPLSLVDECIELDPKECQINEVEHYINLRGNALPYLRLADYFACQPHQRDHQRESVVVVKFGQSKAGFVVDQLHGEHQTVIKPLGKVFENLKGITGATVLGDGQVALILDVQKLIETAVQRSRHRFQAQRPTFH